MSAPGLCQSHVQGALCLLLISSLIASFSSLTLLIINPMIQIRHTNKIRLSMIMPHSLLSGLYSIPGVVFFGIKRRELSAGIQPPTNKLSSVVYTFSLISLKNLTSNTMPAATKHPPAIPNIITVSPFL